MRGRRGAGGGARAGGAGAATLAMWRMRKKTRRRVITQKRNRNARTKRGCMAMGEREGPHMRIKGLSRG